MDIKQLSIFIENKKGRLAEITRILAEQNINIKALSLADTADFGVLRIIVNDQDKALHVLKEKGIVVQATNVIAVEIKDEPGGLNTVLEIFAKNELNLEYMYAFVEKNKNNAIVIIKIDDQERAIQVLKEHNILLVTNEILRNL